jgi:2-methylcitrate dehydratase PrpD
LAQASAREDDVGGLTERVAGFVAGFDAKALPERCIEAARVGIADCVGVMMAGCREQTAEIVRSLAATAAGPDAAPEVPSGRPLSAADAALVNGVAGHVLDYDDVGLDGHPSVVLAPAILAEGWTLEASGADAIAAYVAGYEVWAALLELEPGALHERGFHPTAIWGPLAAAAACARLNRLDAAATRNAIAIAASLAGGLVANFGTMTKSLHAGRAAQAGVVAARLAKAGFTGAGDVLEHRTGFLMAHSPSGRPIVAPEVLTLGQDWRLARHGVNVKRYPMCYATHRAIDGLLKLVTKHAVTPGDVGEIRVKIGDTQALILRNHSPKTGLEAKFSMEFALACALVARHVGLRHLTDDFVRRPEMVEAMGRVRTTTTTERMADLPFAPVDEVALVLKSGQELKGTPVRYAKGSWQRPLSEKELQEKFLDCSAGVLGANQALGLFSSLMRLEELPSLRELPLAAVAVH